ncbi:MAG TPA: threonine--tRNA ligase [Gemmatales bacterium]|nr:threonine--tRNA ligase [Gemmatales bacterium]HMP57869.1 threonine--tRNA ligase [Gemmatales bacterium]
MPTVRLPDGSTRSYASGSRIRDVAASIGKRLAEAAIAAKVDGQIRDLDRELPETEAPVELAILTERDRDSLDVLRHSCAHVMARAVMRLFPKVELAFGPTIENGFYYDIRSDPPIREDDFPRIEEEMKKIIAEGEPFERFELPFAQARQLCGDMSQTLKVEHLDEGLKDQATLSFYRQGEFVDLCRGPHIPHAGKIGACKVLSIAGAYWKNDARRPQLQRLYGTAFFSKKELDQHLALIEEAKKRDHRLLGKQLKLFTINPQQVGPGLILWMPKGAIVRGLLETFIRDELIKRGYQPVYTPHIGKLDLYRTSGHFPYYRDAQYQPIYFNAIAGALDLAQYRFAAKDWDEKKELKFLELLDMAGYQVPGYREAQTEEQRLEAVHASISHLMRGVELDVPGYADARSWADRAKALGQWLETKEGYLLRPMNCPHHIQIYKATPHSYRDLPLRLAEFGTVYRFEQTGELSGLTRVRGFTQDDAHLFMTPDQVEAELISNLDLVVFVLQSLGLDHYRVRVGLRDPASDKYVGDPAVWSRAEETLLATVQKLGLNFTAEPGEAAFYGPKIDFVVRDCIGREWQLGTVQLDYNLPERFGLEYIGPDNAAHRPVMIHRAPFGSMERFIGILIEHFAGAFPLWLAPEQARLMPVSERFSEYAHQVEAELRAAGLRVQGDYRPEKIGYKIREAQLEKIPYMLVVGEKEQAAGSVAVRCRVDGDLGAKPIAEVIDMLRGEVAVRRIRQTSSASVSFDDQGAKFSE